jgi:hypothetical protein
VLGLRNYETAWAWLHKLRRAMVRPGRDLLTDIGGEEEGLPGRLNLKKVLVAVAAQEDGPGIGRIRMRQVIDASAESLIPFIWDSVQLGCVVHTDGWLGYLPAFHSFGTRDRLCEWVHGGGWGNPSGAGSRLQHQAQGTTLALFVAPIGLLAARAYYERGFVEVGAAALICAGFLLGSVAGSRIAIDMPAAVLRRAFAAVLLVAAIKMLTDR